MKYLLDTNVLSEIRKRDRCDRRVARWYAEVSAGELHLSTLVLGEIRTGIERARRKDAAKAAFFETWLHQVEAAFEGRIVAVDRAVADQWGRMHAMRTVAIVDGLLAATAAAHGLTLVTRNASDVAGLGVAVLNPFS